MSDQHPDIPRQEPAPRGPKQPWHRGFGLGSAGFEATKRAIFLGLLMLVLYLPSLYWLKRRRGGVQRRIDFILLTGLLCNLPLIILLLALVNRKMVLSEALGFILTFLIIGSAFGLGFTLAQREGN